jgi:hypothetical protein
LPNGRQFLRHFFMSSEDTEILLYATQLAHTEPAKAYNLLKQIAPRNPQDGNLIAWLIFTAPIYSEKLFWVNHARAKLAHQPIAQQAIIWFEQLPLPPSSPSAGGAGADASVTADNDANTGAGAGAGRNQPYHPRHNHPAPPTTTVATHRQNIITRNAVVFDVQNRDFIEGYSNQLNIPTQWKYVFLWAVIAIVVGGITLNTLKDAFIEKQIFSSGHLTSGIIDGRSISSRRGSPTTYNVGYRYKVKNPVTGQIDIFSRRESVPFKVFNGSSDVAVRYMPDRPQEARIVTEGFDSGKWLNLLGVFIPVLILASWGTQIHYRQHQQWLKLRKRKNHQRLSGRLQEVRDIHNGKYLEVRYHFISPTSGETIEEKVVVSAGEAYRLKQEGNLRPNSRVFILYRNDKHFVAL